MSQKKLFAPYLDPYLDIVDTGATITLNKIRKANQINFTIAQSKNIQIYAFETSWSSYNEPLFNPKISLYIILTSNVKNQWNLHETFQMEHSIDLNIRMNKNPTLARLFYFANA